MFETKVRLVLKLRWSIRFLITLQLLILRYYWHIKNIFVRQNINYNLHLPGLIRRPKSNLLSLCMKVESNAMCTVIILQCVCLRVCVQYYNICLYVYKIGTKDLWRILLSNGLLCRRCAVSVGRCEWELAGRCFLGCRALVEYNIMIPWYFATTVIF